MSDTVEPTSPTAPIDFSEQFKSPIWFSPGKMKIADNISEDLELVKRPNDTESTPTIYKTLSGSPTITEPFEIITQNQAANYYTTDISFLEDSQNILKTYNDPADHEYGNYKNMQQLWNEIKNDDDFKNRYSYLDWDFLEELNTSLPFLQLTGIYGIISPIISLCTPIIMLIVPLIILKIKGLAITLTEYWTLLKSVIGDHSIGRLFTDFSTVGFQDKTYILVSAAFYIYSFYQNIMTCIQFHKNMKTIHCHFRSLNQYIISTSNRATKWLDTTSIYKSYTEFNHTVRTNQSNLLEFSESVDLIASCDYKLSFAKISQLGHILKSYYQLYKNKQYETSLLFSFGFNSYLDSLINIQYKIERNVISFATFSSLNNTKHNVFKDSYYPLIPKGTNVIKNTVKLNKTSIITGPNASGKTTLMKSTLINTILTQQYGVGFYKSATIAPYKYIHCYLNIPDTSGRDSLFQAEAKRCKIIIDEIANGDTGLHLCGFDELFSGTNPEEATINTTALLNYLSKNKRVSSILTTHFSDVCVSLNNHKRVSNVNMKTTRKEDNTLNYSYKLQKGISTIRGGVDILKEMQYPDEILEEIR